MAPLAIQSGMHVQAEILKVQPSVRPFGLAALAERSCLSIVQDLASCGFQGCGVKTSEISGQPQLQAKKVRNTFLRLRTSDGRPGAT